MVEHLIKTAFLLFVFVSCGQSSKSLIINFTGDVILSRGVDDELSIHGDTILNRALQPLLDGDFNVINLETVLTWKSDPELVGYAFRNDPGTARHLKIGSVTHASLANNHSYDFGASGYKDTQDALRNNGMKVLGVECIPTMVSKNGEKVAVLAVSLTTNNDHLCLKDKSALIESVKGFREEDNKIPLIVYIHWGLEYQLKPENWQQDLAHQLIDEGVDAIVGHHPHVFQTVELYKQKPIIYSLGNFVADAYLPNTTEGVSASFKVENAEMEAALIPIDISSYFPQKMTEQNQLKLLSANLKYTTDICYYKKDQQWRIQAIESVNFDEQATEWLFHYENQYGILISKLSNGKLKLALTIEGAPKKPMMIHGELSEIAFADITNDGNMEMLLGISKMVNFDRKNKKRLNIYRVEKGGLQAVWLGTKFLNDLISFEVISNEQFANLKTQEIDTAKTKYSRIYAWDQFGFALQNEIK